MITGLFIQICFSLSLVSSAYIFIKKSKFIAALIQLSTSFRSNTEICMYQRHMTAGLTGGKPLQRKHSFNTEHGSFSAPCWKGDRLYYSGCGWFLKKTNCKNLHTFCIAATGIYLFDSKGMFN